MKRTDLQNQVNRSRLILAEIVQGRIPLKDVRRSSQLFVYGYDEKLKKGYLGFNDGIIIQVDKEKLDLYVRLAEVTKDGPLVIVGEGPESGVLDMMRLTMEWGSSPIKFIDNVTDLLNNKD